MAHQHYCKGKSEPLHSKKEEKKLLTTYSSRNTRAPFTVSGINGKNALGFRRIRI